FAAWLLRTRQLKAFAVYLRQLDRAYAAAAAAFLLSGLLGLFVYGISREKLGQFLVLFFQPISMWLAAGFIFRRQPKAAPALLWAVYWLLAIAGIYAAVQYVTLLGLPPAFWGNSVEPKRALAFFIHPNFYALWAAPLLALLLPDLGERLKRLTVQAVCRLVLWLCGALGLLLSLSRAGWAGLLAGLIVYLAVAASPKVRQAALVGLLLALLLVLAVPNLRWRLVLPLYGEKSTVSRLSLWRDGWRGVKASPFWGLGLAGFAHDYGALNTDPNLDTHNFPHNIFLDFWTETGLPGLVSFIYLASLCLYRGFRRRAAAPLALAAALFMLALLIQGQIDNPYFKNDLALVFWLVLALAL
ncbi:MAG TPA: O-antigen ligase family protein, partial [Patescibacteria group bacterium]|nr:O-antigen ligase family protein [Patescibacteria group bacterium]